MLPVEVLDVCFVFLLLLDTSDQPVEMREVETVPQTKNSGSHGRGSLLSSTPPIPFLANAYYTDGGCSRCDR